MTRTLWTDEQISAFLDGELAPAEMDALARDMETDAHLAARAETLSAANTAFITSTLQIDTVPVSQKLKTAMETPPTAEVLTFRPRSIRTFLVEHRAIAASLLCALAVWGAASTMTPQQAGDPFTPGPDGVIVASSQIYHVLEASHTGEATTLKDGRTATPQLTFASDDGHFCRQVTLSSQVGLSSESSSAAAIFCREAEGWRPQVIAFGLPKPSPDFQTASAVRSPALEAFLDARMSGAPMTAEEEAKLLNRGWTK